MELWVDPSQFIHVLGNVFYQAMETQGHIWIQAMYSSEMASIVIFDTGPGITKEHREHVFEPLYTTKGTGLGLIPCHKIIKHHWETITPIDNPGRATFYIRLPINQASLAKNIEGDRLQPTL